MKLKFTRNFMIKITDIIFPVVNLTDDWFVAMTFNITQTMIWSCEFNAIFSVINVVRLIWAQFFVSTSEIFLGPYEMLFNAFRKKEIDSFRKTIRNEKFYEALKFVYGKIY